MRFGNNTGDNSAPASNSNAMEATDKNGGVEKERGNEHKGRDNNNEADKLWCALAMSFVTAVGGGGTAASEGIYHHGGDGGRFDVVYVEINEK